MQTKSKKFKILGSVIGMVAIALAFHWFNWKLVLVMMLFQLGSNIEQKGFTMKRLEEMAENMKMNFEDIIENIKKL